MVMVMVLVMVMVMVMVLMVHHCRSLDKGFACVFPSLPLLHTVVDSPRPCEVSLVDPNRL